MKDAFIIAGREFRSRLILGSGKYTSNDLMVRSLEAAETDMVTVAVRRVNLTDKSKESLLGYIDLKKYHILPNTAGCYSADEAIRTAMLAREVLDNNWIKLEVLGDEKTLFPDNQGLLEATRAMELGVDGILMNTGVAGARDPVRMAEAMNLAVRAGRLACLSGRIPKK